VPASDQDRSQPLLPCLGGEVQGSDDGGWFAGGEGGGCGVGEGVPLVGSVEAVGERDVEDTVARVVGAGGQQVPGAGTKLDESREVRPGARLQHSLDGEGLQPCRGVVGVLLGPVHAGRDEVAAELLQDEDGGVFAEHVRQHPWGQGSPDSGFGAAAVVRL